MSASESHTLSAYCYQPETQTYVSKSTTKALSYNDVLVETICSGICFTDVHAKSKGCGLGHEGIGRILETGPAVKHLHAGDRVGWGWLHSSCGQCTTCFTGYRQYCSAARGFAFSDLDQGAFGDLRIVDAAFAYPIPDEIESKYAAPLMCAGASVFEALDAAGAKANDRIGVVGIGGLGHMAILFAKAMGCAVTALSKTASKKDDAFDLGADDFIDVSDIAAKHRNPSLRQERANDKINIMLITSNSVPDLGSILPLLQRRATIVLMTIQLDPIQIPYMSFVLPGHRLIASTEASRENHMSMLEFAARNKITPRIETFAMDANGLRQAFDRLETGEIRFRGVLLRK